MHHVGLCRTVLSERTISRIRHFVAFLVISVRQMSALCSRTLLQISPRDTFDQFLVGHWGSGGLWRPPKGKWRKLENTLNCGNSNVFKTLVSYSICNLCVPNYRLPGFSKSILVTRGLSDTILFRPRPSYYILVVCLCYGPCATFTSEILCLLCSHEVSTSY